jgi:hypothetical protein
MTDPETEKRKANPLGIIVALGALGLLLVLLFFQSSPREDVPPAQRPMAKALVDNMMTNGVLVNYSCTEGLSWVNGAVWAKYNNEQKRNMVMSLATVCETLNTGYRIQVLDYDSKEEIARFDGKMVYLRGK